MRPVLERPEYWTVQDYWDEVALRKNCTTWGFGMVQRRPCELESVQHLKEEFGLQS